MSSTSQDYQGDPPLSPQTQTQTRTPSEKTSRSISTSRSASRPPGPQSTISYFSYPVSHVVSGLYRRLTDTTTEDSDSDKRSRKKMRNPASSKPYYSPASSSAASPVFTPVRTASPFQPPPLTPLTLSIDTSSLQQQLLSRALAEEIRLLVPARLQLADTWRLAYSLDRDGASLGTLYENCREFSTRSPRAGYVLVIRDSSPNGAVFGAYMTDPPHPASHYYGTGECFLWRASVLPPPQPIPMDDAAGVKAPSNDLLELAGLPPPPSADTTHAGRSTTLRGERKKKAAENGLVDTDDSKEMSGSTDTDMDTNLLAPPQSNGSSTSPGGGAGGLLTPSGASTPERIRFKAFPYSGVNDYMMFCETGFLSLGGGDGHYGLWMDSSLEKGVSASCQTFGNEHLSDEGVKFDIVGVEVWYVGS